MMELITEEGVDNHLSDLRDFFNRGDYIKLRDMSNDILKEAVLTEDSQLIDLSLICYALFKVSSKSNLRRLDSWDAFKKNVHTQLRNAEEKPHTKEELNVLLKEIMEIISKFYESSGIYVENVIHKARLKQAIRAYAMGLSLGQAAHLISVNKSELLNYIGTTRLNDKNYVQGKTAMDRYQNMKNGLGE